MPTEDRGSHEKRQDKKRENIQQTKHQMRNNRQNTEEAAQLQLRYFGHLNRMKDERYPKIAHNGYVDATRKRGRPKKRWIEMIREDCKELHETSGGHMHCAGQER